MKTKTRSAIFFPFSSLLTSMIMKQTVLWQQQKTTRSLEATFFLLLRLPFVFFVTSVGPYTPQV
jgi:hypothetical protein